MLFQKFNDASSCCVAAVQSMHFGLLVNLFAIVCCVKVQFFMQVHFNCILAAQF